MAISEAQRQEIIDLTGSMSVREIAEKVGVGKNTVIRVQRQNAECPHSVPKSVPIPAEIPARVRARDKDDCPHSVPKNGDSVPIFKMGTTMGRKDIVSTMLQQLDSELVLYEKAKLQAEMDPQAKWEVVQHQKLVQSALNALAKWCGLDKGTMPGADDAVESVTEKDVENLSLDEMLKIASEL